MPYIPNVTDAQQTKIERAADDSAIRLSWFDGRREQTPRTKFVRAFDLRAQGNQGSTVTDVSRQFGSSGHSLGSHNDHPCSFRTPGKA
jgi:hypothetical protein